MSPQVQSQVRIYQCSECGYKTDMIRYFNEHRQSAHIKNQIVCDKNERKFPIKGDLASHHNSDHEVLQFVCNFCEYRTFHKNDINQHLRTKHGHNSTSQEGVTGSNTRSKDSHRKTEGENSLKQKLSVLRFDHCYSSNIEYFAGLDQIGDNLTMNTEVVYLDEIDDVTEENLSDGVEDNVIAKDDDLSEILQGRVGNSGITYFIF